MLLRFHSNIFAQFPMILTKLSSLSIPEKRLDYESLSILLRLLLSLERFPHLIWHSREIERHVYLIREISLFLGNWTKREKDHKATEIRASFLGNHDEINYSHIQSCFIPSLWEPSDSFLSSNRNENINVSHASLLLEFYDELTYWFRSIGFMTLFYYACLIFEQSFI